MIHLDTNFLIMALVPASPQDIQLRQWFAAFGLELCVS
jgi:hypothetical protein